jgi:hypothetical protein
VEAGGLKERIRYDDDELLGDGDQDDPLSFQRDKFGDKWHVDLILSELCKRGQDKRRRL